ERNERDTRASYEAQQRRLRHEIGVFAGKYPDAWTSSKRRLDGPFDRVVRAFLKAMGSDAARVARLRGMELRLAYGYRTPEEREEAAADVARGVACLAAEELHGPMCKVRAGGDRLTAEEAAFYVADDWWPGRDELRIDQWVDIRRVRQQILLDAVDM